MTAEQPARARPWWRRWWAIAIAAFVVLMAIAGLTAPDEPDGATAVQTAATTTSARASTSSAPRSTTTRPRTTTTAETRPGNPDVYARIEAMTDCGDLQEQFDIAMDSADRRDSGDPLRTASLAYAKAADDRMQKLDCYD